MIALGSKVRDTLTGFTGIATGRAEFLYGCVKIQITPDKLVGGKPVDPELFDEQRVEVIQVRKPRVSKDSSARSGGPQAEMMPGHSN